MEKFEKNDYFLKMDLMDFYNVTWKNLDIQLIIYGERFDRNGRTVTELLLLIREETFAVRIIDLVRRRRRMIVENQLLKDLKPDERGEFFNKIQLVRQLGDICTLHFLDKRFNCQTKSLE